MKEEIREQSTAPEAQTASEELTPEEQAQKNAELRERLRRETEEERQRLKDCLEAMKEGRGILRLEKPLQHDGIEITELVYDFTVLTGLDYTEAMDDGAGSAPGVSGLSYRQALSLFAMTASRQNEGLDMRDILEGLGATDAVEAVELASIFFVGSIRAGRQRISKR